MTANLKKIDGVYNVAIPARGKTKYISTGASNKTEAAKIVAESGVDRLAVVAKAGSLSRRAIGQILSGKNVTCAKALREFLEFLGSYKSANTVTGYKIVLDKWLAEMKLETTQPSAVTRREINSWINNPDSSLLLSTRRLNLSRIRSFFSFCASKGWIVEDLSRLVEIDFSVLSHEQKEKRDREPFTESEVKHLVRALEDDLTLASHGKNRLFEDPGKVLFWYFAVSVARDTGLRISDIAQMEWRSFGEKVGKLVVWTGKTNKRVEHPITEKLADMVALIPVNDAKYMFPEQCAIMQDTSRRAILSSQFERLCKRVGIEGKSFHLLRHFKASNTYAKMDKDTLAKKLAESLSLDQIATLLGHSNKSTTKGYVH